MSEEIKSETKFEEPDLKKQKKLKQLSDARLKKQKVKAERTTSQKFRRKSSEFTEKCHS